jgi:hypothetical protein
MFVSLLRYRGILICDNMLKQFDEKYVCWITLPFLQFENILLPIASVYIVTYLGFSIHDGTLLHSKSQYTTVKHRRQLFEHVHVQPARSRNTHSYSILPTGPLVAIFQHSLPFLQYKASKHTSGQSIVGLLVHLHTTMAPRCIVHR